MRLSRSLTTIGCAVAVMMLWVGTAEAQRRAVPRGGSTRVAPRQTRVVHGGRHGYRNYRSYRVYSPYAYGFYDPYFYGPYAYGYQYPYYGARYLRGSVRLQVKPERTEVYVDGYHAGLVDQYDGFFQRLHLPPGEHEIELYLDGHESIRETFYLVEGETYKLLHEMTPLADGVVQPPRPKPAPVQDVSVDAEYEDEFAPELSQRRRVPGGTAANPNPAGPFGRGGLPPTPLPAPTATMVVDEFGTLALRVQPGDAQVFVDGESWEGFAGLGRLEVELGVGSHVVEIRREGYRPYRTDVDIHAGESTRLNVSLPRADGDAR